MKLWILTLVSLCVLAVSLILLSWEVFPNLKEPIGVIAVVALLTTSTGAVVLLIRRAWQYWSSMEVDNDSPARLPKSVYALISVATLCATIALALLGVVIADLYDVVQGKVWLGDASLFAVSLPWWLILSVGVAVLFIVRRWIIERASRWTILKARFDATHK